MPEPALSDFDHSTACIRGFAAYFFGAPIKPPVTENPPPDKSGVVYDRADELGGGTKDPALPQASPPPRARRPDRGDRL